MSEFEKIVRHYERCLDEHGYHPRSLDWPNTAELGKRFQIMLDIIDFLQPNPTVLDLGCGIGLMLEYLRCINQLDSIQYRGIDYSKKMIQYAKYQWPNYHFSQVDILKNPLPEKSVDYVILNGVFTEKQDVDYGDMQCFVKNIIAASFLACKKGIAFNIMSPYYEWCRMDLFYWSLDELVPYLTHTFSPYLKINMDYGLYEYTVYLYREPRVDVNEKFIKKFQHYD